MFLIPPNPLLNEQERALLNEHPEESFRMLVERGALAPEQVTADLEPPLAAALQYIASGERLEEMPEGEASSERRSPDRQRPDRQRPDLPPRPERWEPHKPESMLRSILSCHPRLLELFDAGRLTHDQALEAAWAMDHWLGRYPTGTRYAAP
ncbi:MAG: hypothetical protein JXA37_10350 [Chloroflexia bacterium]|nr:hypothetical protein [Chloroflexia bacterium]